MSQSFPENVWTDGCYDFVHYGHLNQLRQAKSMGRNLIVGLHSDEEISKNKSNPVMVMNERMYMLQSLRWVDIVVSNAPYFTHSQTLDEHNCEFCVHGDDTPISYDGSDPYLEVKKCGRYRCCNRTLYISTTDIIERVLNPLTSQVRIKKSIEAESYQMEIVRMFQTDLSCFPQKHDKVVYIGGNFEILHPSNINYLRELKSYGNYLLVGVYSDKDIQSYLNHYPILSSVERSLSVMACKYVDWVIIDAPFKVNKDFINYYHIWKIFFGDCDLTQSVRSIKYNDIDERFICNNIPPRELSADYLWDRIRDNRQHYEEKVERSKQSKHSNL